MKNLITITGLLLFVSCSTRIKGLKESAQAQLDSMNIAHIRAQIAVCRGNMAEGSRQYFKSYKHLARYETIKKQIENE